MNKAVGFLCGLLILVICQNVAAADKDKLLFEINKARSSMSDLAMSESDKKAYSDDILTFQNYLKLAESAIKGNTSFLGNVDDSAVPSIQHYIDMANLTVAVVRSRLEKNKNEAERDRIEKAILEVKAKIKVFDDKNAQIEELRAAIEKARSGAQKDVVDLNNQLRQKQGEIDNLASRIDALKAENDKKVSEFSEVQSKLSAASKLNQFLEDVAAVGFIASVSADRITLLMQRSRLRTLTKVLNYFLL